MTDRSAFIGVNNLGYTPVILLDIDAIKIYTRVRGEKSDRIVHSVRVIPQRITVQLVRRYFF